MGVTSAVIRYRDGEHALRPADREVVAERLLETSRKHSFDPDVDVRWVQGSQQYR